MERIVVVGARRRRQGIGHWVTRRFVEGGAGIAAIVGTSDATVAQARRELADAGIDSRGYTDLHEALQRESPDAVALCSPFEAHRDQLGAVAAAGAHCLCEKPLWWGPGPRRAVTGGLVDEFARRGLYLELLTQWPCTLASYRRLYPMARREPVESFEMGLGPVSTGPAMILDAAPHVLSMLAALVGPGTVSAPRAGWEDDGRALDLTFDFEHAAGTTGVACRLRTCPEQPRPAWYSINGRVAHRVIEPPAYSMRLARDDNGPGVELPDPLADHVGRFLAAIRRPAPPAPDRRRLVESITNLEILLQHAKEPAWPNPSR